MCAFLFHSNEIKTQIQIVDASLMARILLRTEEKLLHF